MSVDFDFEDFDELESGGDNLIDNIEATIARVRGMLGDLERTIEGSEGQVEQLRQRSMNVMAAIQRMEGQLEQVPRERLKQAYNEALNTQQRLINSQAQLDKLREQYDMLNDEIELLEDIKRQASGRSAAAAAAQFDAREMIMKVIDAQEAEREHLAERLHDGPAHALTNFILLAEICQKQMDRDEEKARRQLAELKNKASDAFTHVRAFIFDLRPMMLRDLGLAPTLQRYVQSFQEKSDIEVRYEPPNDTSIRMENYREVLVFRGIQAIMTNAREGGASEITVILEMNNDYVRATVEDNGGGVGTGELRLDSGSVEGVGLGTLQERVTLVGGRLDMNRMGGSTRIEFEIPTGPEPSVSSSPVEDMA